MLKQLFTAVLLLLPGPVFAGMADRESYIRFMNGMMQERRGNFDVAMQEYSRVMLLSPGEPEVLKQALNLALRVGRLDDAARWAEYVVKADSSTAENWVLYGNAKWARGENEAAQAAYEKAAALDPQNHEALYQLASLISGRDPDKAADYLRKYLEVKPEDAADIYYQIAVIYNAKGNYAEAEKNLLLSKDADSFYLQPRYMLAGYYETRSDTAAAIAEYQGLVALDGKNPELLGHLGELYASPAVGDLPEAEKYFLAAYALDKADAQACFWLSVIAEERKDFAQAAAYMEGSRALKEDPGAVLRLSYYYTQSGRYPKAVETLEAAAKKWPDNNEVAYFLALGYDDTGRTPKALEQLRALARRAPNFDEGRMQLGVICERTNNMPCAEEQFRYLLGVNPNNPNVLNYLGYSLADRGLKLEEARGFIEKAVSLDANNGAYRDSLAWVYFRLGLKDQARGEIAKAAQLVGEDPEVWEHAGDISADAGDHKAAWNAYKNAWLFDKPDQRPALAAKAKAELAKVPPAEAAALESAYLRRFSPAGLEFSSFAKVQAKLRGKSVKFDAMVRFVPPDNFTLTVMGPLMAPIWKARSAGGMLELDPFNLEGVDPNAFNYWAGLMTEELAAWFSGAPLDDAAKNPAKDCSAGADREVCLGEARAWPGTVTPNREKKLTLTAGDYFMRNLYLFPGTLEFKMPFVSVKLILDQDQMNFQAQNSLSYP